MRAAVLRSRRGLLGAAPRAPLSKPVDEIGCAKPSKRGRPGSEYPLRCNCEMRRRGELENAGDVSNVVSWILGQLRCRDETNEIDNPFEIRCAGFGEVATKMLATETDRFCQCRCRHWPARVSDHHFPGAALQLRR